MKYIDTVNSSCGINKLIGDTKMSEEIQEADTTQNTNNRFKADLNDPTLITDLLSGQIYRVIPANEVPSLTSPATKHLLKIAEKTLKSLNDKHQIDYFWGDLKLQTRNELKDHEIFNLNDLLTKIDELKDIPSESLISIIKLIIALKVK